MAAFTKITDFMSEHEWSEAEAFNGLERTLKWGEIEENKRFCLNYIEQLENSKYDTYILHYTDQDGNVFKAYSPSHFIKEIRKRREPNMRPYFVSYGSRETGSGRHMANFEIRYRIVNKSWDIFHDEKISA